jgi:hypothetical protein
LPFTCVVFTFFNHIFHYLFKQYYILTYSFKLLTWCVSWHNIK